MLFLIVSEPRAEKPSEAKAARRLYWDWLDGKIAEGVIRHAYPKAGRGMAVIADVPDHETLSGLLNAWAEMVPAQFVVHPLVDPDSVRRELGG